MLQIVIPGVELFNSQTNEFKTTKEVTLSLEHSLVSVSKWESKWKKPFLTDAPKSREESLDYIRCMTITQNVPDDAYSRIDGKTMQKIQEYIDDPMTATWFNEQKKKNKRGETITAELIYFWMVAYNIPFECQKWHLNKLLTLIKVCDVKNSPEKKMGKKEAADWQRSVNARRKAALNTKG